MSAGEESLDLNLTTRAVRSSASKNGPTCSRELRVGHGRLSNFVTFASMQCRSSSGLLPALHSYKGKSAWNSALNAIERTLFLLGPVTPTAPSPAPRSLPPSLCPCPLPTLSPKQGNISSPSGGFRNYRSRIPRGSGTFMKMWRGKKVRAELKPKLAVWVFSPCSEIHNSIMPTS